MAKPGPKTDRAKAAVRRNAVKHGIRSEIAVIDGIEDPKEWKWHRDGIIESLQPEGVLEFTLAERVAMIFWKLKRVDYYQAIRTRYNIDQTEAHLQTVEAHRDRALPRGEVPEVDPEAVQRYELLRVLPGDDMLVGIWASPTGAIVR